MILTPAVPSMAAAGDLEFEVVFPDITGATVEYYTNKVNWQTVKDNYGTVLTFDYSAQFIIPSAEKADYGSTTIRVSKGGMSYSEAFTLTELADNNYIMVPVATIRVLGIADPTNLAIVQSNWVYTSAPADVGVSNYFPVFDNGKTYEIQLKIGTSSTISLKGIDVSSPNAEGYIDIDLGSYYGAAPTPTPVPPTPTTAPPTPTPNVVPSNFDYFADYWAATAFNVTNPRLAINYTLGTGASGTNIYLDSFFVRKILPSGDYGESYMSFCGYYNSNKLGGDLSPTHTYIDQTAAAATQEMTPASKQKLLAAYNYIFDTWGSLDQWPSANSSVASAAGAAGSTKFIAQIITWRLLDLNIVSTNSILSGYSYINQYVTQVIDFVAANPGYTGSGAISDVVYLAQKYGYPPRDLNCQPQIVPIFGQQTPPPTPTPVPPTSTPVPPTSTPVPPTSTPVPPTSTPVPPTSTPVPPTSTPVPPTSTPTPIPPTPTIKPSPTPFPILTCEVKFVDEDGTQLKPPQSVAYGFRAIRPTPDPVKDGYTFVGWYYGPNQWNFDTPVFVPMVLVAKWSINTYRVTFDSGGGSDVPGQNIVYGNTVAKPADPTRVGFKFLGWYVDPVSTDPSHITLWDFANRKIPPYDFTLFAHWEQIWYSVTFVDNNGPNATEVDWVTYDTIATAPAWTRSGYVLEGWYKDPEYKFRYGFTPTDGIRENTILYARWLNTAYKVTISYEVDRSPYEPAVPTWPDDGPFYYAVGTPSIVPAWNSTNPHYHSDYILYYVLVNGKTVTPSNFTQTYYGTTGTDNYKIDCDIVFVFQVNTFTVNFETEGGTVWWSSAPYQKVVPWGTATLPDPPTKAGYDFDYWYEMGAPLPYNFSDPVVRPVTLYAHWSKHKFDLTFNYYGAPIPNKTIKVEYDELIPISTLYMEEYIPTRVGYDFLGWWCNDLGGGIWWDVYSTRMPPYNVTLFAIWQIKTYTVTYDRNNGSGYSTSEQKNHGDLVTNYNIDAERAYGWSFGGWYTDAAGNNAWDFNEPLGGNLRLFAKWLPLQLWGVNYMGADAPWASTKFVATINGDHSNTMYDVNYYRYINLDLSDALFHIVNVSDVSALWVDVYRNGTWFDASYLTGAADIYSLVKALGTHGLYDGDTITYVIKDGVYPNPSGVVIGTFEIAVVIPVTVWFSMNDGTGAYHNIQTIPRNSKVNKPATDPTRALYNFMGWVTAAGVDWDFDDPVPLDMTLYAKWLGDPVTVWYDCTEVWPYTWPDTTKRVGDIADMQYYIGERFTSTTSSIPYVFYGWYHDAARTIPYYHSYAYSDSILTGNKTLYALWLKEFITVNYHYGVAEPTTIWPDTNVQYNQATGQYNPPQQYWDFGYVRNGYAFVGWYDDPGFTTPHDFTKPATDGLDLYADWVAVGSTAVKFAAFDVTVDGTYIELFPNIKGQTPNYTATLSGAVLENIDKLEVFVIAPAGSNVSALITVSGSPMPLYTGTLVSGTSNLYSISIPHLSWPMMLSTIEVEIYAGPMIPVLVGTLAVN